MGKFRNVFFGGYQKAEEMSMWKAFCRIGARKKRGRKRRRAEGKRKRSKGESLQREHEEKNQLLKQLSEMKANLRAAKRIRPRSCGK